jgi:hypothetical protein
MSIPELGPNEKLSSRAKEALARDNAKATQAAHAQAAESARYPGQAPVTTKDLQDKIAGKVDREEFEDV